MNAALESIAVLQNLERQIQEREQKLADIQSTLSFEYTHKKLLSKELRRLRFQETIRRPAKDFELWPVGIVIVGVAISILLSWLLFFLFGASFGVTFPCVGIVGAIVAFCLIRVMFVPSVNELLQNIGVTEQALMTNQTELLALEKKKVAIISELSRLEGEKRRLESTQKYKAELLLTQNWKAMRDSEWEQFLAEVFVVMGGHVTKTGASGDQGVDLVVDFSGVRTAIQAKGYYNAVGNAAVQQAVAGKAMYNCRRCAVITNSRFTKSAQELAASNDCMLFDEGRIKPLAMGDLTFLFLK